MPRIDIPSLDDPRLAPYRHLKETNATRREGLFVCEGEKLARRLIASGFPVASVLVGQRWADQFEPLVPSAPLYVVPDDWIEQIIGFNFHRGVLACGKRRRMPPLLELAQSFGPKATVVVCPDVQDPENLGSILRLTSAFGVDAVLLGPKTADPFSRRVLRVSMGACLQVPMAVSQDVGQDLELLARHCGFERWATVLEIDAAPLGTLARPDRLALLFGSEGHGLEPALVAHCEHRVTIPMPSHVDSLNVAVAAGIFLYHLRQ